MSAITPDIRSPVPLYRGLRMTADEFFALPDDGHKYELVNGVVIVSPGATPLHQIIAARIQRQIGAWLDDHPIGEVFHEVDIYLGPAPDGSDLVYRPDLVFMRSERLKGMMQRITVPPDLVVEVISPDSRGYDTQTKRSDYERHGVGEYWLIDPEQDRMTFLRLEGGRFVELSAGRDRFDSPALPGFGLELAPIRALFTRT